LSYQLTTTHRLFLVFRIIVPSGVALRAQLEEPEHITGYLGSPVRDILMCQALSLGSSVNVIGTYSNILMDEGHCSREHEQLNKYPEQSIS
jgi:hypothetical protein